MSPRLPPIMPPRASRSPALKSMLSNAHQVGALRSFPIRTDFANAPTFAEGVLLVGEAAGLDLLGISEVIRLKSIYKGSGAGDDSLGLEGELRRILELSGDSGALLQESE